MQRMTTADTRQIAAQRFAYGSDPEQFGELRLPEGDGQHPAVVYVHGGGWRAEVTLAGAAGICSALTAEGFATWSIEYRRVGNGGGWPATFEDAVAAAEHLKRIAEDGRIDLSRVVVAGQSAGGQLALWLAAQQGRGEHAARLPRFRAALGLAPSTDLRQLAQKDGPSALPVLLGGLPDAVSERYAAASPLELLPLGLPQLLVHGTSDTLVPYAMSQAYQSAAERAGDRVELVTIEGAEHLDLWNPASSAFPRVVEAATSFLRAQLG